MVMSARVLVLGAAGRLGHKAGEAFRDAGWTVISLVRSGGAARAPADTEVVQIDALNHPAVGESSAWR
jgi:nucleoside-diphosphate-sugar epimerase